MDDKRADKIKKETKGMVLAILLALTIRWALFEAYVIPSESMMPTLLVHDHIFVNKLNYGIRIPFGKTWLIRWNTPKRGDVIVFRSVEDDGTFLIKRVVGVPGDKISYDGMQLLVNDKQVENLPAGKNWDYTWFDRAGLDPQGEKYTRFVEKLPGREHSMLHINGTFHPNAGPLTVPDGSLFMMGDNRDDSRDSRFWGFAPLDNVLGNAMFIWLSCDNTIPVIGICSPLSIRWGRIFHNVIQDVEPGK